jgi:hypothetical protein
MKMTVSIFAGEAEGRFDMLLQDAAADRLQPLYNFLNDLPGIEETPVPLLPLVNVKRTLGLSTSFDADHFICPNLRKPCVRPVLFLRHGRFPHVRSVPLLQTRIFGFDGLAPQSI